MIRDDEYLERIVAGINALTTSSADVRWNETINGRQFDVVARFSLGLHKYLVLYEVKNRKKKATAEDLDAFVTKCIDNGANKSAFITTAGFQSGAIDVATRHGVDLFHLEFDKQNPDISKNNSMISIDLSAGAQYEPIKISLSENRLVANIEEIEIFYEDGSANKLPNEPSQMTYYVNKSILAGIGKLETQFRKLNFNDISEGEVRTERIDIHPPTRLNPPDSFFLKSGKVIGIELKAVGRQGRMLTGNTLIESSSFSIPVIYTNISTGERFSFRLENLPLQFDGIRQGEFYQQMFPLRYYFCEDISGDTITWSLIESFQNGHLVRCTFRQNAQYGRHFIPVSDKSLRNRLKMRLNDYQNLRHSNAS
jgi:hypothetical protein